MEQVYISRKSFSGETIVSALGLFNIEGKTLLIPGTSKKGTLYIKEIKIDNFLDNGDHYLVTVTEKGKTNFYVNTYYCRKLVERKEVKA